MTDEQIRRELVARGWGFERYSDMAREMAGGPKAAAPAGPPTDAQVRAATLDVLVKHHFNTYGPGAAS